MSEYTPTADIVRSVWCAFSDYGGLVDRTESGLSDDRNAEFDRWLAAHDAEVAGHLRKAVREALREATAGDSIALGNIRVILSSALEVDDV